MGNKIRSLSIVASFALLSLLAYRNISLQVKKVGAVPGQLEMGTGTQSTTYYNNDSVYRSNIMFGDQSNRGGVIKYTGELLLLPSGTPDNIIALDVNDVSRTHKIIVGPRKTPAASDKSLEVAGDANLQGNVGIGYGVTTSLADIPLHVYNDKPDDVGIAGNEKVDIVSLQSRNTTVHLGEYGNNLAVDTGVDVTGNILVNGTGGSNYFAGNVGIGTTAP